MAVEVLIEENQASLSNGNFAPNFKNSPIMTSNQNSHQVSNEDFNLSKNNILKEYFIKKHNSKEDINNFGQYF